MSASCKHYEERSRHGARAHKREGTEVCKQCAAAAAAAGRISRHGFDPWVEATGAPTWPVEPLREYVAVLCDRPERHAWRSRSSPNVPPTSAPAASAGALVGGTLGELRERQACLSGLSHSTGLQLLGLQDCPLAMWGRRWLLPTGRTRAG